MTFVHSAPFSTIAHDAIDVGGPTKANRPPIGEVAACRRTGKRP